jgi:hypothetical protein
MIKSYMMSFLKNLSALTAIVLTLGIFPPGSI